MSFCNSVYFPRSSFGCLGPLLPHLVPALPALEVVRVAVRVRAQGVPLQGRLIGVPHAARAQEAQVGGHVLHERVLQAELKAALGALEVLARWRRLLPDADLRQHMHSAQYLNLVGRDGMHVPGARAYLPAQVVPKVPVHAALAQERAVALLAVVRTDVGLPQEVVGGLGERLLDLAGQLLACK